MKIHGPVVGHAGGGDFKGSFHHPFCKQKSLWQDTTRVISELLEIMRNTS